MSSEILTASNVVLMRHVALRLQVCANEVRQSGLILPIKSKWRDEYTINNRFPDNWNAFSVGRVTLRIGESNKQITSASVILASHPQRRYVDGNPDLRYLKLGLNRKDHSLNKLTFMSWVLPTHELAFKRELAEAGDSSARDSFRVEEEAFFDHDDQGIPMGATEKVITVIRKKGQIDPHVRQDLRWFLDAVDRGIETWRQ